MVKTAAKAHQVDPLLVGSVIEVESNYNQYAVSPKGAEGLMQLMPATARMLGVRNSFDPMENIEAGVRYLKSLQEQYKDDRLALAAYNAGPAAVDKYKFVPPYPETRKYVDEVGKRYEAARAAEPAKPPSPEPAMTIVPNMLENEERHPRLEQFVDQDGRLHLRTAN
jgi:soluble lytic murein transglycosylase-like protein